MKNSWQTPVLTPYGAVELLTQRSKTIGKDDGVILSIPGLTPPNGIPIGS